MNKLINRKILNKITPYLDVNRILRFLTQGITHIFKDNLAGLYLTGSLSYGDFNQNSSDIDLVAVLHKPTSSLQLQLIKQLHIKAEKDYPQWAQRIECSYVPRDFLPSILPPQTPRPYWGEGKFYSQARYGNEWIINNYLLYHHGIAIIGPDFKTLIKPINIAEVQQACIRDLIQEWQPKIAHPTYLHNSHYQAYVVLNLCRILYTVLQGKTVTKTISAAWVKHQFPQWNELIELAESWHYGKTMNQREAVIDFINFAISQVSHTQPFAYQSMLARVAGSLTASSHPEWATSAKIKSWVKKQRLASDRQN